MSRMMGRRPHRRGLRRVEEAFFTFFFNASFFPCRLQPCPAVPPTPGLFTGLHEIHKQVIKVQRMLAERLVQRRAALRHF